MSSLSTAIDALARRSMAPAPAGSAVWVAICPVCHPLGALAGSPSPSLTVAEQAGALVLHCANDGCLSRRSPHLVLVLAGLHAPAAPAGIADEPDEDLAELTVESGPALVRETAAELAAAVELLVAVGGTLTLRVDPGGGPAVWDLDLAEAADVEGGGDGQPQAPEPVAEEPAPPAPRPARRPPSTARAATPIEDVMEQSSRWLEEQPEPVSGNALESGVGGNRARLREALELLVAGGHVATERGARNATLARSVRPYRVATSPAAGPRPDDSADEVTVGEVGLRAAGALLVESQQEHGQADDEDAHAGGLDHPGRVLLGYLADQHDQAHGGPYGPEDGGDRDERAHPAEPTPPDELLG